MARRQPTPKPKKKGHNGKKHALRIAQNNQILKNIK